MGKLGKFILVVMVLALVQGCSRLSQSQPVFGSPGGPGLASTTGTNALPVDSATPLNSSSPTTSALPQSDLSSPLADFIAPEALALMSDRDKSEASSAQYFALQTGRPGAPRNWSGNGEISGTVTVGPFIRVNNLDCREFTHTVDTPAGEFSVSATSCRSNGEWSVAETG